MFSWAVTSVASPDMYKLGFKQFMTNKAIAYMDLGNAMQMADYQKMEMVRARADEVVQNKETAESLKPYYNQFCKRPCFHDEYLQTFNLPNVELIDTDGKGLSEISEKGIIFDGKEYEVDCIIFATGFEVGTDYSRRAGYQIYGVDGVSVSEKWQDGLSTFHGMHSKGFPNCFFFGPAQSGFTATFTYSLDEQSIHLAYILKTAKEKGASRIEASKKAEDDWVRTIIEKARLVADFQEKCTPGYYNNEGNINRKPQNGFYGAGPIEFFSLMKKWRSKGNLEGLELTKQ
jgi:cyclohexanone monooxygenase